MLTKLANPTPVSLEIVADGRGKNIEKALLALGF